MNILKTITGLLFLVLLHSSVAQCQTVTSHESGQKDQVAVLPFRIVGFSPEEGTQLTERFAAALAESGRFHVLTGEPLRGVLAAEGLNRIDSCTTVSCLARLGVLLRVGKVVLVTAERWGERCVLHMQVVGSSRWQLLYDEAAYFTGSFDGLLATVTPEQGRKLSQAYLDRQPDWYVIAGGVFVVMGLIIWIYTSLGRRSNSSSKESTPTPTK